MKAVYLLPCSCGKKVRVDSGQAGAKVACECGQQLAVPTFRGLSNLEVDQDASALVKVVQPPAWTPLRGILFSFGLLVTVVAVGIASYHLYIFYLMRDGGEAWKQQNLEAILHDVDHLSPTDVYGEFMDLSAKGLVHEGVPPWAMITTMRDNSIRWLAATAVALVVGLTSLIASLFGARRPRRST